MLHRLYVEYTEQEVSAMYGDEFFKISKKRPNKPKISSFSEFDSEHQKTYLNIAKAICSSNEPPVEVWAFGSRVGGRWMEPQEDPRGLGSDWDIFTTGKNRPGPDVLYGLELSSIRIDYRMGFNPPPHAVKIPYICS